MDITKQDKLPTTIVAENALRTKKQLIDSYILSCAPEDLEYYLLQSSLVEDFMNSMDYFFYCQSLKGTKFASCHNYSKHNFPDEAACAQLMNDLDYIVVSPTCKKEDKKTFAFGLPMKV